MWFLVGEEEYREMSSGLREQCRIWHRANKSHKPIFLCYFIDGLDSAELSILKPLSDEELHEYGIYYLGEYLDQ